MRSRLLGDILGIESEREQGVFPFSATKEGGIRAMIEALRKKRALQQIMGQQGTFEEYVGDESALDRLIRAKMGGAP